MNENELEEKVFKELKREITVQGSNARFDCLAKEVFEELNDDIEIKLKNILNQLQKKKMIYINGDRIGIINRDFDFLIPLNKDLDINELEDVGLEYGETVDIGHGCNEIVWGITTAISTAITLGAFAQDVMDAWKTYKTIMSKLRRFFKKEEYIYHSEKMLMLKFDSEIYERYREKGFKDREIISIQKIPFGSKGLYAVQNDNYDKTSLAGTPEFILSIAAKVRCDKLKKDYHLIRAEFLSNGEITRFEINEISCTDGIDQLI